jgi:murein DD-endopeptidase MepM/ murein hydrolase activator NlpD
MRRLSPLAATLPLLVLAAGTARAQGRPAPPPPPPLPAATALATSWHTVRPGETLRGIAAQFLGSAARWTELHQLNPFIADPDRIAPGQRVRVPAVASSFPAARLNRLSRQVEDQPSPIPWHSAQEGDVLVERDGLRTHQRSSADMQFLDGARLLVTEDSLVFFHRAGNTLRGTPKKSIEIVEGQAELETRSATAAPAPEVEIVLGGTRATSRPDSAGNARTRARRAEQGSAKVMAYGGESEVEAGGAKVQVPHGMGTSVAAQGPPSPPEPLLAAPTGLEPVAGAERACADPLLAWQGTPQAAAYIVEVCRDPACGALVERRIGDAATQWRPDPLPVGELYWRVTARSRSGLDGYPSEAIRLAITSDQRAADRRAATGAGATATADAVLQIGGPQVRIGERLFVAPSATVVASGGGNPAAAWVPVIGGQEAGAWPATWTPGEHTAAAVIHDGCGNGAAIAPVAFVVDAEAPVIRWEVGDRQALSDRLAPDSEKERERLGGRRSGGIAAPEAWSSRAGVWRLPLPWAPARDRERDRGRREDRGQAREKLAPLPIEIASDHPQAFFTAPDTILTVDGKETTIGDRILWVDAEDAGAGVERVIFRTRAEGDRVVLEVEARDMVGNVSRKEIALRKGGGR